MLTTCVMIAVDALLAKEEFAHVKRCPTLLIDRIRSRLRILKRRGTHGCPSHTLVRRHAPKRAMPRRHQGIRAWMVEPAYQRFLFFRASLAYQYPDLTSAEGWYLLPRVIGRSLKCIILAFVLTRYRTTATYGFTILVGSTMRSNSSSVTKPSLSAAAFKVRSWSIA